MVSFTVRLEFAEADRQQMEDYLRKLTEATRQEPGCVTFVPHFVKDAPPTIVIYEQYVDDAAAAAHRASPHFAQYAAGGFFKLITSRKREDLEAIA